METMSADIGALALALSKAQAELKPAVKDSTNPFFKSKYADLASVWDAAREVLAKNELAVVQTNEMDATRVVVVTTLIHSSGQWVRGLLAMKPVKDDPQGVGSCITYARRYALASIVGVSPEDDDAEGATARNQVVSDAKEILGAKQYQSGIVSERPKPGSSDLISPPQEKRLYAIRKAAGISDATMKTYLLNVHGLNDPRSIKKSDYEDICEWAESQKGKVQKPDDDIPFGNYDNMPESGSF